MISAAMIVRDGSATIERAIAPVRPHVDEVVVLDTGSMDGTLELLQRIAGEPGSPVVVEQAEWADDFAAAREGSFELVAPDAEWVLWIDADDVLVGGENIAAIVERAEAAGATAVLGVYDHHDRPDGTRNFEWNHRIVRPGGGRWEGRVHEHWRGPDLARDTIIAHPGALRWTHLRREQRAGHYLPLIRLATEDPASTPRAWWLLGRELAALGATRHAIEALETYLARGDDAIEGHWNPLRASALHWLAELHAKLGLPRADLIAQTRAYLHGLEAAAARGEIFDPERWRQLDANAAAWAAEPVGDPLISLPTRTRSAGRNEPCPCGSGAKFKRCCADRRVVGAGA